MRNNQRWMSAVVQDCHDISPTIREFTLAPEGGVRPYTPGSHLQISVAINGRAETRHYSLVGQAESGCYRIAVKLAPDSRGGSRYMWRLLAGGRLDIAEPNNHFELGFQAPEVLLVAGGIGITPIVGMAQTLAHRKASVRMLYGARTAEELVYQRELRMALGDRITFFTDDAVGPAQRRMDLPAEIARLHPDAQAYICGPMPLLDAMRKAWQHSGRPMANLRFETFGNSGQYAPEKFWVKLPRHNLEIEVPVGVTLLDAVQQAGIDTLFECKRGECGLCVMNIVAVTGTVDHRDVFLGSAEKQQNMRLCACVSRVVNGGVVLDSDYRPDAI
jgi:vanillate O-demethylase ferredoxin subunit